MTPTDAVAATSVGGRLGLPSRLTTIIEGEGLVNDASALVLLASASTAINKNTHVWRVGVDFLYSAAVATAVGIVVGLLGVWLRSLLDDAVFTTAISFVLPFVAFLPAERLHASGVLAVVFAELVAGALGPALALAIRMIFVAPIVARLRRGARRAESAKLKVQRFEERFADSTLRDRLPAQRRAKLRHRLNQHKADIDFSLTERFGWRGGGVLAWSGMRGAITVAAATLIVQGVSLPWVIKALNVPGDDREADNTAYADLRTDMNEAAANVLHSDALRDSDGAAYSPELVDRVGEMLRMRSERNVPTVETDDQNRTSSSSCSPWPWPPNARRCCRRARKAATARECSTRRNDRSTCRRRCSSDCRGPRLRPAANASPLSSPLAIVVA